MTRKALYCTIPFTVDGGGVAPVGSKVNVILLGDDADYTPAEGLELRGDDDTPIWSPPVVASVPDQVANADARRVMLQHFVPDGRSFYTVVNSYLQSQVTGTATLPDNDPNRIAALSAWTQWDMGNFFYRADPLVAAMAQVITAYGGTIDLDELFIAAASL